MNEEMIPILDLSAEIKDSWTELTEAIHEVLRSGRFILGPQVGALEEELAAFLHARHAVGLNSGTDALVIALRSLSISTGHEVITTPFSFFATAEAISLVGAKPVFVDIDPVTFNIDPDRIEEAVTAATRAIIPVHLYGQAADMDSILTVARKHGLAVVEDVAQSMGGLYGATRLGTLGAAGAFSFFPSKNLGAFGDGGLLATNDDDIAERARMLRTHGSRRKYENEMIGYNSRLDELQAAILRVKLRRLDAANDERRRVAQRYSELLDDIAWLTLPVEASGHRHVYHQYTVRIGGDQRGAVAERLRGAGISTMVYYPVPIHQLPIYRDSMVSLKEAERASREVLSLPIWPGMPTDIQDRVVAALRDSLR